MIFRRGPVLLLLALLPSCGLVRLPFRVAGAVVEGTTDAGRSTYNASKKVFGKSEEEKAEEKKAKEEANRRKAEENRAARNAEVLRHSQAVEQSHAPAEDSLSELPPPPDDLPTSGFEP